MSSLKIEDDDDLGDLGALVQRAFRVRFDQPMLTVGDVFDAIDRAHADAARSGPSVHDLARTRLKQALSDISPGVEVLDSTALTDLRRGSPKSFLRRVARRSGLLTPAAEWSRAGSWGCFLLLVSFFLSMALALFVSPRWWFAFLGAISASVALTRLDPGRLLPEWTVAWLADEMATLNFASWWPWARPTILMWPGRRC